MLYVAYGSNLDLARMKARCPSAKVVTTGYLEDTALDFRYYADIIPAENGDICPVAVYDIAESDWKKLDEAEDCPNDYIKKNVCVLNRDPAKPPTLGIAYVMRDEYRNRLKERENYMPSIEYLSHITRGYIDHKFTDEPKYTMAFYNALMRENLEQLIEYRNKTHPEK
ncbi:MAG: gamma-glutamylcyclotransferase [Christensenellaceae bacterium]|jgi:gamma-glutamylcyclotransferase (GGCT)/AIG2-like uncharacterized protein YtfP|nr:gamma-glutamylcyclotransferase [Christensenellaceae bacterium]